jgi:hypothetical protein
MRALSADAYRGPDLKRRGRAGLINASARSWEDNMATSEPWSEGQGTAAAAYLGAGEAGRLRGGRLRFFRTIAESVGVQAPTAGVVIAAAVLAGISGGGTALVQIVAAVAMGFVAYAFVIFTRGFNSAGSVYGFTGPSPGPDSGSCPLGR